MADSMESTSEPRPDTELPILPEPQCLKDLINSEECTKPFEKKIASTDDNKLVLHKPFVMNECVPLLTHNEDVKAGLGVTVFGHDGTEYLMNFGFCPKIDKFVLNGRWEKFSADHALKPSEHLVTIWMFRHKTTDGLCFAITCRPVPKVEEVRVKYKTNRMRASNTV